MKTYSDFLGAIRFYKENVRPVKTAYDIWTAAKAAGFERAEILKHYARYRLPVARTSGKPAHRERGPQKGYA